MSEKTQKTWENQEILVAVGFDCTGVILGYKGEGVSGFIHDWGNTYDIFNLNEHPVTPGVYVWIGRITQTWIEDEVEYESKGLFRTATSSEMKEKIGVRIPEPPVVQDDDREY